MDQVFSVLFSGMLVMVFIFAGIAITSENFSSLKKNEYMMVSVINAEKLFFNESISDSEGKSVFAFSLPDKNLGSVIGYGRYD